MSQQTEKQWIRKYKKIVLKAQKKKKYIEQPGHFGLLSELDKTGNQALGERFVRLFQEGFFTLMEDYWENKCKNCANWDENSAWSLLFNPATKKIEGEYWPHIVCVVCPGSMHWETALALPVVFRPDLFPNEQVVARSLLKNIFMMGLDPSSEKNYTNFEAHHLRYLDELTLGQRTLQFWVNPLGIFVAFAVILWAHQHLQGLTPQQLKEKIQDDDCKLGKQLVLSAQNSIKKFHEIMDPWYADSKFDTDLEPLIQNLTLNESQ